MGQPREGRPCACQHRTIMLCSPNPLLTPSCRAGVLVWGRSREHHTILPASAYSFTFLSQSCPRSQWFGRHALSSVSCDASLLIPSAGVLPFQPVPHDEVSLEFRSGEMRLAWQHVRSLQPPVRSRDTHRSDAASLRPSLLQCDNPPRFSAQIALNPASGLRRERVHVLQALYCA